jgi:hypothetical protein
MFLGIDPGNSGGFALINKDGDISGLWVMPRIGSKMDYDRTAKLIKSISGYCELNGEKLLIGIEKPCAFLPGKIHSNFPMLNYGTGFGVLIGAIAVLEIPYLLIHPKTWQKEIWTGSDKRKDPKKKSLEISRRLFPKADLRATARCKKPHDGLIDALLIAEYCRRKN